MVTHRVRPRSDTTSAVLDLVGRSTKTAKKTPPPLSQIELSHKFLQCALGVLKQREAEQILNRLWQLEHVADVTTLFNAGDLVDAPRALNGRVAEDNATMKGHQQHV